MAETDDYRREVTGMVEAGWRIEEETTERVTLVRRTIGSPRTHLILAVLTIWWTLGIPNLLYAAYRYVADAERTIVWKGAAGSPDVSGSQAEAGRARGEG